MERRYCKICGVEGAVLSPENYRRVRQLFLQAQRSARGRGKAAWSAALQPLYREYEAMTGERPAHWVHIIVHQLRWQPQEAKPGTVRAQ
jgi:hypothetical protein